MGKDSQPSLGEQILRLEGSRNHWKLRATNAEAEVKQLSAELGSLRSERVRQYQIGLVRAELADISRLLFEAREQLAMWADVVEHRANKRDEYLDRLISEIDDYRAGQGWSPNGFGGEDKKYPLWRRVLAGLFGVKLS